MDEHGGNIEKAIKEYRLNNEEVIDFSANTNPLPLPHLAKEAIAKALRYADRYPEPEYSALRKGLADFYQVEPQNMLVDNGSISLIYLIPRALGLKRPLLPLPAFSEYERSVRLCYGRPRFLKPGDDFILDIDKLIKELKKADSLWLCNPNNPTGLMLGRKDVLLIVRRACDENILVILDEVFIEFTRRPRQDTFIQEAQKLPNLIVLRSMTKFFGLAGLRLGLSVASANITRQLKKYQVPWSVNSLAVAAAGALIKEAAYINNSYKLISRERDFLHRSLCAFDSLEVYEPSANFIFCKIKSKNMHSAALRQALARKGILIRDCANFRGLNNKFFRVALRMRRDNLKLIVSLKEVLN
jgi:threonine-phosphate decarboxylase